MDKKYLLAITIIIFGFFLPFFVKPAILTEKNNDLGRTYIAQSSFLAESLKNKGQIPLWYPNQMMGQTYVGNPVSALFYPGNLIFLFFPVNFGVVVFYFLHLLIAAVGTYYLARSKNLTRPASYAAAVFYALSVKMLLHLTAGHLTMVAAFSLFPLLVLFTTKLWQAPRLKWMTLSSVILTFIYFAYPTVAFYSVIFILAYFLYQCAAPSKKITRQLFTRSLYFLGLGAITLGLSAIYLLPQIEFSGYSNRTSLTLADVAQPIWNAPKFALSLTFPYPSLGVLDHESLLYLGAIPTLLAIVGFFYLARNSQLAIIAGGTLALFFAAGTSTPLFAIFYKYIPLLSYSRVTTRFWFIVALVVALLAAVALCKIKNSKIIFFLVAVYLFEVVFLFYTKTIFTPNLDFSDARIYQYLAGTAGLYRVYCTTYCFNPQETQKYGIDVLHGETPIAQSNFVNFLEGAGNYEYGNFTVIYPPYQVWQVENPPIPNLDLLSKANVKFIASTYPLKMSQLIPVGKYNKIFLYRNENVKERAYFKENNDPVNISFSSPNYLVLKFPAKNYGRTLVFSQNYYPGWFAYNNNNKQEVKTSEGIFVEMQVAPKTEEVILKYSPKSYLLGKTLTFGTVVLLIMLGVRYRKTK